MLCPGLTALETDFLAATALRTKYKPTKRAIRPAKMALKHNRSEETKAASNKVQQKSGMGEWR